MGIDEKEHEIPADMLEKAKQYREEMIDKVSMFDDELAEKFLAGEDPDINLIKRAIRKGTTTGELYPIMCGSALGNK